MTLNTVKFSQFAAANLANANYLVGVTSLSGGTNFQTPAINSWDTAGRPISPITGTLGYNTDNSDYEFWNGASWVTLAAGGSGTVGIGGAGQIAYYENSGTGIVGTNTIPNTVATQGITNGTNATAGDIGEFVSSYIDAALGISLSNMTPADITTISLTAGDWDIFGNVAIQLAASASPLTGEGWVSLISATLPNNSLRSLVYPQGGLNDFSAPCPYVRVNVTTTTTVYLTAYASFSSGSVIASGGIYARRAR